jgi:hypothetical protein
MAYHTCKLQELDTESTRQRITDLFRQNHTPDPEQRYPWLYRSEFARTNVISRLLLDDDRIVGIASALRVPAEKLVMASFVNLLVDERHRTLGPALILEKELLRSACEAFRPDLLIAKPNPRSRVLFKRMKFTDLGPLPRYSSIANPAGFLKLGEPASGVLGAVSRLALTPWLRLQQLSGCVRDGELEGRWQFHETLADVRQALPDFQAWRYADQPNGRASIAFLGEASGSSPYVIFHVEPASVLSISDIGRGKGHYQQLLAGFMLQAMRRYHPRNFSLTVMNDPDLLAAMNGVGFIERMDSGTLHLFVSDCAGNNRQRLLERLGGTALFSANIDF